MRKVPVNADFMAWLTAWLRRHPVQSPPQDPGYAAGVMARVRAPAPSYQWVLRPRAAWAVATVAVCGMTLMAVRPRATTASRMAADVQRHLDVLAAVGEVDPLSGAELEQDAFLVDHLLLAEEQGEAEDELWLEETLELLSEVEEEAVEGSGTDSADELLDELDMLDEQDIGV